MSAETVRPSAVLTRPAFLLAVAVLALNDHVLKATCPGLLTGKLSDLTGLFAFPLGVWALFELAGARVRLRTLAALAALTGLAFTLLKTNAAARALYLLPYGLAGVEAAVAPDLSDLLCLPVLGLAVAYGRWHLAAPPPAPLAPRLTRAAGLGGFVLASVATPAIPHHQFMLAPEERAAISEVVSGLVVTHVAVDVQEGARGLFWDDDATASATVEFRCPGNVRPGGIAPRSLRAVVGDSVWGLEQPAKLERLEDGWRATAELTELIEGSYRSRALNQLRLALDLDWLGEVELACTVRDTGKVLERQDLRGRRLLGDRRWKQALAVFDWLIARSFGDRARLGRARALIGLGKKDEAYAELMRCGETHPTSECLEAAKLALELRPNDETALWLRCRYYLTYSYANPRAAVDACDAYLEAHPQGKRAREARRLRARCLPRARLQLPPEGEQEAEAEAERLLIEKEEAR